MVRPPLQMTGRSGSRIHALLDVLRVGQPCVSYSAQWFRHSALRVNVSGGVVPRSPWATRSTTHLATTR
jgi:hypothetical protein